MAPIRQVRGHWSRVAWIGFCGAVGFAATWVRADAPFGRYTIANGTVRDTQTGLTWQQTIDPGTYSRTGASSYCTSLPLDGGGFRVPSARELQTIIEEGKGAPMIDTTAFPGAPVALFWTSSAQLDAANAAWLVNFDNGDAARSSPPIGVIITQARVRCVR